MTLYRRISLIAWCVLTLSGCVFTSTETVIPTKPITTPSHSLTCPQWELCFTPGEACTSLIQTTIQKAKKTILVQAYGFTSEPIGQALVAAKKRGVSVQIILDKSNKSSPHSLATLMLQNKIPLWIDSKPAIAHNKIMIIDDQLVITGSFNFSQGAQAKNAENLLVIHDPKLAKRYTQNWEKRLVQSTPFTQAMLTTKTKAASRSSTPR